MSGSNTKASERIRVIINSANRVDPVDLSNNFTYTLDKAVERVSQIEVVSVQIPFSYYAINDSNNKLTVNAGTATLTNGNYTSATLPAMLKTALDALGPVHTVTYSAITGRLRISQVAGFTVIVGGANDAGPTLGFPATTAPPEANVTSRATANWTGPNYLVIKSAVLTRYNATPPATAVGLANDTILHTVPVNANAGSVIIDTPGSGSSLITLNAPDTFETLIDFRLEDDQGNLLDLNGADWSMQLLMHVK
jgi:hypothetical protein